MDRGALYKSTRDHLAAGLINVTLYAGEGEVPDKPPRMYGFLSPGVSPSYRTRLVRDVDGLDWFCAFTGVGTTMLEVLDVLDQADQLLNGWDPDPMNLSGSALYDDGVNAPILSARVAGDLRYSGTKFYRLSTDRR